METVAATFLRLAGEVAAAPRIAYPLAELNDRLTAAPAGEIEKLPALSIPIQTGSTMSPPWWKWRPTARAWYRRLALALGEGGEQNAPLGRAVIGGLTFATVTTLFVAPIVYTCLHTEPPVDHERRLEELNTRGTA